MSSVLDFGKKHNGKTLVETVFTDPAWLMWAIDNGVFRSRGKPSLQREAEILWHKARNIRIPPEHPRTARAAYYYQGWSGKFLEVRIVADGRYEEHADINDILDLGYVCIKGHKDVSGNNLLTKGIKRILFGERARVTGKQLEQFFANPANFDLPDRSQQAAE